MYQFIQDFVHLTRVEFALKYWWLELTPVIVLFGIALIRIVRSDRT
jgi:hypothetical protein